MKDELITTLQRFGIEPSECLIMALESMIDREKCKARLEVWQETCRALKRTVSE